ncbi:hypothetical protein, partial [Stutzerimonas stutzeri]|uniref:hypothetical protein n=1 Tax=Stutzerimonas stutzeri TaxID=316 RepID=UPI002158A3BF
IQLLKSVSIKPFVSTEAAHSTAAFLTVKLFFENLFSTQPLAASINLHLSSAGGESYSVQNRCQPPLQPLSINPTEATNRTQPPPCQRGAFYSNPPPVQPFYLANLLIYKRFCLRTAPEVVRIIGT